MFRGDALGRGVDNRPKRMHRKMATDSWSLVIARTVTMAEGVHRPSTTRQLQQFKGAT